MATVIPFIPASNNRVRCVTSSKVPPCQASTDEIAGNQIYFPRIKRSG